MDLDNPDSAESRVRALASNDNAAWESFYDEFAGPVRAFALRLGSRDPNDTLGEVMVQVVRDIGRFRGNDSELRSWVFTIARHRVIDEGRRRSRRPVEVAADEEMDDLAALSPASPNSTELDPLVLDGLLSQLTPDQKEVLWLRFGADMSLAETAEVVGKDVAACAALSHRGLRRLRNLLEARNPEN